MPRNSAVRRWRSWRGRPALRIPPSATDVESANRRFLLYGVLPLWFVPGVADWVMHRRTRIEKTSGTRESLIHLLMMAETGTPVALGLLARINPLVLSVMGAAAVAHGATAMWDVTVATGEREVRPLEQHIHSFLEVLPLTAAAFATCLHWDQARSMVCGGTRADGWKLLPKDNPLPARYLAGVGAAVVTFVALPYGEELLRCLRARRVTPECCRELDGPARHS
ncbi:diguanylate cyclase [Streptantibioticus rubrisoli]|uniref:Diguanylate cyclase n=1 Tax=Streptantibioticus rubrisoli TaxID=1387313 RepID=A0ABT1PD61_9ACTN|nr:diguanylate cyclase [Streptantibioticus rubrisoli]MCQ4043309.1 diguanylate cyclase [Streptantibioticus rubrisoli]